MTRSATSVLFLITMLGVAHGQSSSDTRLQARNPAVFAAAIEYEYKNIFLTYLMMKELAETTNGPEQPLWQAYADLESFNLTIYLPLADKFGVEAAPDAFTKFKAKISVWAAKIFTRITIYSVNRLANKYVLKLQALRDAAPPEYDLFFDYVVAQEALQVDFMPDAIDKNYETAYTKVQQFLEANMQLPATVLESKTN